VADYALGDIQGCYDALQRLLTQLDFDEQRDRLWFVGDLVNRGPQSLAVLRFIKQLPLTPQITLGNHDLYLLDQLVNPKSRRNHDDTLDEIRQAPDKDEIAAWLRQQRIMIHAPELQLVMVHAGIPPCWTLPQALQHAHELEQMLLSEQYAYYLSVMYGNTPNRWSETLDASERFRVLCNYFTRMRYCDARGGLVLESDTAEHYPWYAVPNRQPITETIVFGHWAALQGKCPVPTIYALDTGYVWGGQLTALRLSDKQRFSESAL
jgi:bis(5'-nucleosyl)-tetraphosphatase (symmetrical)